MSKGDFIGSLFDFEYDPTKLESWVKLGCQVTFAGAATIVVMSLDGRGCGRGWAFWQPQTWGRPVACTVRSLFLNVPEDFNEQKPPGNVVRPANEP